MRNDRVKKLYEMARKLFLTLYYVLLRAGQVRVVIPKHLMACITGMRIAALPALLLFAAIFSSCGGDGNSIAEKKVEAYPVTFSFFDVDVNTVISGSLKERLDDILGDHSTETHNTISLDINREGFLKEHFPYYDDLNRRLNSPARERVEHNTLKITYRYAGKKNLPFSYVEFLFSDIDGTPLIVRIRFKVDELNIVDTLKEKYGEPEVIPWREENGKSLCWQKDSDLLVLSFVPDQFGIPEYEVVIYFSGRIEDMLKAEMVKSEIRQKREIQSGKNAF